jgi:CTP:molybdopterin cytidylyltransferase MocA
VVGTVDCATEPVTKGSRPPRVLPNARYTRHVTVAAVILSATTDGALTDTLGQPRVRRLVDLAWSGGALPVMVVAPDPDGAVAATLVGTEAVYGSPAPSEAGPVGQMVRGTELAIAEVRDTTAALLWPARMVWVGPETITSLIEAHGPDPATVLLPGWQGEPGWPVLVPVDHLDALRAISPDTMPLDVIHRLAATVPARVIEMGDPGVIHDADTAPADLPAYEGPPDPPAGHTHEWGADVAAEAGLTEP